MTIFLCEKLRIENVKYDNNKNGKNDKNSLKKCMYEISIINSNSDFLIFFLIFRG